MCVFTSKKSQASINWGTESYVRAADFVLEEFESLKEEFFELQEERKSVLLKLGIALEKLKELT
jgi:hypothetical protein